MPESSGPERVAAFEADMFLEDVEQNFDWRTIPYEGWICIPIFWVLACVVFWQFFTRYALDSSAVWTEEVARQLLILLTFYGAGYALRTRAHICISYFVTRLRGGGRKIADEISSLLQLAFYGYSIFLCIKIAKATQFQTLMSVDVSKSAVYYAVAASFVIMALRCLIDIYRVFKSYRDGITTGRSSQCKASQRGGVEL